MNLFWKKLLGQITPTEKLEKRDEEITIAMKRYEKVSKSVELAEYQKLFQEVKTAAFIEHKKTLQNRKYKDTEECRAMKRFNKLHHSPLLKTYYKVLNSAELKAFVAFEKTPEYLKLGDKKEVAASEKLQNMKAFEKSKDYKTYCRFHDSFTTKEYEELKKKVESDEFKQINAFWENPQRWQTTTEYKREQRFYELAKNPDIEFYTNEKPERFKEFLNQKLVFADAFDWNSLDKSSWNFGFHYKNPTTIGNHSFSNEKQANNGGKNSQVRDGILTISTKKETVTARAWNPEKGFVMQQFDYTADVLQTGAKFRQKGGIFSAKIRCTGNVNHAFWLGADGKLPHINIFHFDGHKINVGNAYNNIFDGTKITGINPAQFYIYTLKWTKNELIWMLNNIEVYRTSANIPKEEMFLVFNSFIPQKSHGSEGTLEIDWVKVYQY